MLSSSWAASNNYNQHTKKIDLPTRDDRKNIKISVGKHLQVRDPSGNLSLIIQVWSRLTISLVYPLVSGDFYAFSFSVTNPSVAGGNGGSGSRFVWFYRVVEGWLTSYKGGIWNTWYHLDGIWYRKMVKSDTCDVATTCVCQIWGSWVGQIGVTRWWNSSSFCCKLWGDETLGVHQPVPSMYNVWYTYLHFLVEIYGKCR